MVECRTPEREVRGSRPTAAVLCPWARHFTPRKYWLITQEAMAPSRYDWKIVDWDVKPQHNQISFHCEIISNCFKWCISCCYIGIKHDFSFINIRKVPEGGVENRGPSPEVFNISLGTLRMLMNDKIMFDRYYCINSKETHLKLRKCLHTLFFSLTTIFLHAHAFYKYPRFRLWPGTFFSWWFEGLARALHGTWRVYKYNSVGGL